MRRFAILFSVFALSACPPSLDGDDEDIVINEGDVVVNNYYGDDDDSSAPEEEPTPEPEEESLESYTFWDSWSGGMEFEIGPSTIDYPLDFGSWTTFIYGEPGTTANLSMIFVGMVNGVPWDGGFAAGFNDGFAIADHVENCSVYDNWSGWTVWDEQSPDENGVLAYDDSYTVSIGSEGYTSVTLNLQCAPVLESLDLGEEVLVSFMLASGENIAVWNDEQFGQAALLSDNVWPNNAENWPRLYTRFYRPNEKMSVFAAWDSWSGNVAPGWVELGRFVFAPQQASRINSIVFTVDGWDNNAGWKSCAEAMNPARWNLLRREIDLATGDTSIYPVFSPIEFVALSGTACSEAPEETLGYVNWYGITSTIAPSSTVGISYSVEYDAGDASSGDWIQIGITDPTGFKWTDLEANVEHNGADGSTTGLPAWGNQLTFN